MRRIAVLLGILALAPTVVHAQRLMPDVRYFRTPIADPFAARISVGLKQTNLLAAPGPERPPFTGLDGDMTHDVVAAVGIGGVLPLVHIGESEHGGQILYADARVFSRFRIMNPSRDDMGQDWFVGGGIEMKHDAWSGRAAIIHRSSHLGDEFIEMTGAERIEFGGEQLDATVAYDIPDVARVYGGGSWVFRSYLGWEPQLAELGVQDRGVIQVGADRVWQPWNDRSLAVYAGVDVQAAERTEWDVGVSAAAGIGVQSRRSLRLMTRFYNGPSTMGEFFLTPERFVALELVIEI